MNILIVIPARGGSKGIPRKNVRSLAGKPLIYYSIINGLHVKYNCDVYVSSEDDEILSISQKFGAKVFKRDLSLSLDSITLDAVIYDTYKAATKYEQKHYDLIVTLQPTSPLLTSKSIELAIESMINDDTVDTIISAKEETHLTWGISNGQFVPNYHERLNRQYLPKSYTETGGFLICRESVISEKSRIGKKVSLHILESKETIDIDNYEDWSLCEFYLKRKKIVFLVSGYNEIGLGHIYNSLILASSILEHEIIFFCDSKSALGYEKIKENNYPCLIQSTNDIQEEVLKILPDVIISDRLDTKVEDVDKFLDHGVYLIHFEDLGDGAKQANLVFNAIYPENEKLRNHYFGPKYFCARDEFIHSEIKVLSRSVNTVLIAFGGVDPNNLTLKVIQSIYEYCQQNSIKIQVVCGFGYKYIDSIQVYSNIEVFSNVKNISMYMLSADIVFTSAGRTTYELAILGLPSIVLAQNERELTHFFAGEKYGFINLGLGLTVSNENILAKFKYSLDYKVRQTMQQKMLKEDLKLGKQRVVNLIKNLINNIQ
ncbi:cytidylyltransferase domain-containing protein [Acidiluteibacter ferrifornacis]|uniref:Acylneuraminate cytidylyltransferase n=1 Tax=Acidiluteibacter ferrifornacis TaxID=2692424 RepID=A0A6N9NJ51_9FLAO|nr:acylneuraminate cytidylyltransferase [Acidiluteibacter ferrifornacis]NBG65882.1 acylneuraminate cytidylyltransferase [Acidiluteibacter ferrifornacis]